MSLSRFLVGTVILLCSSSVFAEDVVSVGNTNSTSTVYYAMSGHGAFQKVYLDPANEKIKIINVDCSKMDFSVPTPDEYEPFSGHHVTLTSPRGVKIDDREGVDRQANPERSVKIPYYAFTGANITPKVWCSVIMFVPGIGIVHEDGGPISAAAAGFLKQQGRSYNKLDPQVADKIERETLLNAAKEKRKQIDALYDKAMSERKLISITLDKDQYKNPTDGKISTQIYLDGLNVSDIDQSMASNSLIKTIEQNANNSLSISDQESDSVASGVAK